MILIWPYRSQWTQQHKMLYTKGTSQKFQPKANLAQKNQTNVSLEITIKVIWIMKRKIIKKFVIEVCRVKMREVVIHKRMRRMNKSWRNKAALKTPKKKCTPTLAMMISRKKIQVMFSRVKDSMNLKRNHLGRPAIGYWCLVRRRWRITQRISIIKTRITCRIKSLVAIENRNVVLRKFQILFQVTNFYLNKVVC